MGGVARLFGDIDHEHELSEALTWAAQRGVPVTVLGGGSNVVVSDRGVDGLVLRIRLRGVEEVSSANAVKGDAVILQVGAGEELDALVARAVEHGHAGIECLSGIPGYVGATPIQNVGAYGQEISEVLVRLRALRRATVTIEEFEREACGFLTDIARSKRT